MAFNAISHLSHVLLICVLISPFLFAPIIQANQDQRKTYIIYMGDRIKPHIPAKHLHIDMLSRVLQNVPSHKISDHLLYSYESFHGCVANLTEKEANIIAGMDGVVSVFPNLKKYSRTTKSWDFMDFPLNVERNNDVESDVIIGVIDYGIWPEHESFRDDGLGPPPAKWKGVCQNLNDNNFTCNNKIIGARYFRADGEIPEQDIASPRDTDGHGTHCASTAAGRVVKKASFLGLGLGTARGGVPSARIAVYKPCWSDDCTFADIMAAFDMAILDGVDILSVSLGGDVEKFSNDPIAIGAFHAMRKGILTSTVAGNSGPSPDTLEHYAPWLLVVGASTMDRNFTTKVLLGNGMVIQGSSTLNTFDLKNKSYPLIYGGDAPDKSSNSSTSRFCSLGSLDKKAVKGKIVLCISINGTEAFRAGAAGMIAMRNLKPEHGDFILPLPSSIVGSDHVAALLTYTRNTTGPFGTILKSVEGRGTSAPLVAYISSRGPSPFSSGILKPDLVAPGVSILAAWSPIASASGDEGDERFVSFNMIQGTSMACPHAAAVAAYVKSFHPTWSESAIRSALMTTAIPMRRALHEEAEFAYGSGHLNPLKAISPGLVYEASVSDYVKFLCSQGLNETAIRIITGESSINCQQKTNSWDLNYPSMALDTTSLDSFDTVITRTVTNVGSPNSTYAATVTIFERQPLEIVVKPSVLSFNSVGQSKSFTVRVSGNIGTTSMVSASLVWDDGQHKVRSPIVVFKSTQ